MDTNVKKISAIIRLALKRQGTYSKDLEVCIHSTAVSYYSVLLAEQDIENLDETYVTSLTREGNEKMDPHPAFKVLERAQNGLIRGLRELKLTASTLAVVSDDELEEMDREHEEIKASNS